MILRLMSENVLKSGHFPVLKEQENVGYPFAKTPVRHSRGVKKYDLSTGEVS
mgnify:CR=1 FL=1